MRVGQRRERRGGEGGPDVHSGVQRMAMGMLLLAKFGARSC